MLVGPLALSNMAAPCDSASSAGPLYLYIISVGQPFNGLFTPNQNKNIMFTLKIYLLLIVASSRCASVYPKHYRISQRAY